MLLATVLDAELFRPELFKSGNGWAPTVETRLDELRRAHIWITNGTMFQELLRQLKADAASVNVDEETRICFQELRKRLGTVCRCHHNIADCDGLNDVNEIGRTLPTATKEALKLTSSSDNIDLMFTTPEWRSAICKTLSNEDKVQDFWTYPRSRQYRIERRSREIINTANEEHEDVRKLLGRFIKWSQDVVVIDRYIAEAAWFDRNNWEDFHSVIRMLFDLWKNREIHNKAGESQFRIITVIPGKPNKDDPTSPYPPNPADVRGELLKRLNEPEIEVEIREVPKKLKHDRYLVVHDGSFVISSSTGFDFKPNEPCEIGFRRMKEADVVKEVLRAKLLTERPITRGP